MEYLRLVGLAIVIVGFAAKLRVTVIVLAAGVVTGGVAWLLDGPAAPNLLDTLGKAFANNRPITLFVLALPAIGLCERHGLQEQARRAIARLRAATVGRLLLAYHLARTGVVALGIRLGSGHVSFTRPLIAPMALGIARARPEEEDLLKGASGASENYANFFGQNLFPGAAGVLIVVRTLEANGHVAGAIDVALATVPVAVVSLLVATAQYALLDRLRGARGSREDR
jgi:uncharacterized membrane protein